MISHVPISSSLFTDFSSRTGFPNTIDRFSLRLEKVESRYPTLITSSHARFCRVVMVWYWTIKRTTTGIFIFQIPPQSDALLSLRLLLKRHPTFLLL
ncbi:hypothetical protein PHJA_002991200 [Phtheirospermum japonicum]|uniref:Uncharacterized protein n=1 Tax=Phtheirospermum japonicum TaxID=374723 RepID=A0A830CGA4_9LAMI|nr:hypothetical protein PHJA_001641700 [Phtheirospermum japonicum]GFQ08472.1 hypothetical protein PHJA_002991200 [Phtheirospermum japonicum]